MPIEFIALLKTLERQVIRQMFHRGDSFFVVGLMVVCFLCVQFHSASTHSVLKRSNGEQVNELLSQVMVSLAAIQQSQHEAEQNEAKIRKLAKSLALTSLALMGKKMSAQEKTKILSKIESTGDDVVALTDGNSGLTKHQNGETVKDETVGRSFGIGISFDSQAESQSRRTRNRAVAQRTRARPVLEDNEWEDKY